MPWYLRKSFKIGPVRLNLSKSGVGNSVGVTGFRAGVRPNGKSYLHAGRYGLYFRQELGEAGGARDKRQMPISKVANIDFSRSYATRHDSAPSRELAPETQDEAVIKAKIRQRDYRVQVTEDWLTPAGRRRSAPMYKATIRNDFLGKTRTLKSWSVDEIEVQTLGQFNKWAEQEFKQRIRSANQDATVRAEADANDMAQEARNRIEDTRAILAATLDVDNGIEWKSLEDTSKYPPLKWTERRPAQPNEPEEFPTPAASFWEWLIPSLKRRRLAVVEENQKYRSAFRDKAQAEWRERSADWEERRIEAEATHKTKEAAFYEDQERRNKASHDFRARFESGDSSAIVEYLAEVFKNSKYPKSFHVEHSVTYDATSRTAVIDLRLPTPEDVSDISDYEFSKRTREARPIGLSKKEHDALYGEAIKQTVLRTAHEVFDAEYTEHVVAVGVNGWVTVVDRATGRDRTSCIISFRTDRRSFERLNLARIDCTECLKSFNALIAGPLCQLAHVQPVLQLNRDDD